MIGEGGFGKVYLVADKKRKKLAALKLVSCSDERNAELALEEALMLSGYSHPNIVALLGEPFLIAIGVDALFVAVPLEFAALGDLTCFLRMVRAGSLESHFGHAVLTSMKSRSQLLLSLSCLHSPLVLFILLFYR